MSTLFNEASLEAAILELFGKQGYEIIHGGALPRLNTEILLRDDLKRFLLTRYEIKNITDDEIDELVAEIELVSSGSDYASNKTVMDKISNGFIYRRKDPLKKDFWAEYIDFENPENNTFKIINQFEIQGAEFRIPDAIVFINGIPLVVLEFKSATREEATLFDAYKQIAIRYRRGISELLKYNAFCVISDGANTKMGSHFAPYEFFYGWRRINGDDKENISGISALEAMIAGLFDKARLVDVIRHFIYFPDKSDSERKIVPRYPQYYAARKLHDSILAHRRPASDGKGGVYFGATGCGKSITMLYLARLLMCDTQLKAPTLLFITDRTDLDAQLSELFEPSKTFLRENDVRQFESRADLQKALGGNEQLASRASGGIFMTTVQKFTEDAGLLTERDNVICISDEAHRSQLNLQQKVQITKDGVRRSHGFAHYLHQSLPNATYVGFTGTPIDETLQVFGKIVDRYTMIDSVKDGITVRLIYDGRAARVGVNYDVAAGIEDYYAECEKQGANASQVEESKIEMTRMEQVLGSPERMLKIAKDFIAHYERRVTEGASVAGKTLFVCASRQIALAFYKQLGALRPDWMEIRACASGTVLSEEEKRAIKPSPLVQMVMTRGKDDPPELYNVLGDDDHRREQARQYKQPKSNFKIALIVDMWLTGFDVPELDVICLDKPIQKHSLIQAVSRVNRKCEGKNEGVIVDYIGIKKHLDEALSIYTRDGSGIGGFDGIETAIQIVRTQLEVLRALIHPFDMTDFANGNPLSQLKCLQRAVEKLQSTKAVEDRFMAQSKILKDAWWLCCGADIFSQHETTRIQFFLAVRSILYKLTKGDAPDAAEMNRHVEKMLEQALSSDDVQVLFQSDEDGEKNGVNLFDEKYLQKILSLDYPNTKVRLLQKLLKAALRKLGKVNKIKAVEFTERLNNIVQHYNDREADKAAVKRVLGDLADALSKLIQDVQAEQKSHDALGISYEEKAFYDILKAVSIKHNFAYAEEKFLLLAKEIKKLIEDKARYAHFLKRADIKAQLERDLILLLGKHGYPPEYNAEVFQEIFEQTANFKRHEAQQATSG